MTLTGCWRILGAITGAIILAVQGCAAQQPIATQQTMKNENRIVVAAPGEVVLPDSGFVALSDLTDRFAADLSAAIGKRKLFLDRAHIRDAATKDVANFSIYLENELDASLSSAFQLVNDRNAADYLVGAVFQRYGNSIRVFFKYHDRRMSERKSLDYTIERLRLPADSLKENMRSKAFQLAANIIDPESERTLYLNPVLLGSCDCVTEFSRSLKSMLRTEIVRLHPGVQVVEGLPANFGTSSVQSVSTKGGGALLPNDARSAGADAVIEGDYLVNGDLVLVNLALKDLSGTIINTASVDIDRSLITVCLNNPAAEHLADLADRKREQGSVALRITTSRGRSDPVYRRGEQITFLVQTGQPLYAYIYNIRTGGEVALLYPYETGRNEQPLAPGQIRAIPAASDDFVMDVIAPFGNDIVKVFAAPVRLPVPQLTREVASQSYEDGFRAIATKRKQIQQELSRKQTINPDDLVDYYRGLADQFGVAVFEDSLIVETKPH